MYETLIVLNYIVNDEKLLFSYPIGYTPENNRYFSKDNFRSIQAELKKRKNNLRKKKGLRK